MYVFIYNAPLLGEYCEFKRSLDVKQMCVTNVCPLRECVRETEIHLRITKT